MAAGPIQATMRSFDPRFHLRASPVSAAHTVSSGSASSLDAESLRHCAIVPDRNDPALRGVSHLREIRQSKNASGPAIASRFITLLRRSPNRFLGSEYCVAVL